MTARMIGAKVRLKIGVRSHAAMWEKEIEMTNADTLPLKRAPKLAYRLSLVVATLITFVSVTGLVRSSEGLYQAGWQSVLVSEGGDAANLILVPVLLASMWLARRGSLVGLLLWPGGLFYALYAYAIYLVGAPFGVLVFAYAVLVILGASTLIGIVSSIDGEEVRHRLAGAPARIVGGALVFIALLAYIGLTATAIGMLENPAAEAWLRPQWVVDCALGTPAVLLGGALLWRRSPLGYVVAPGLLFVSGLGGWRSLSPR